MDNEDFDAYVAKRSVIRAAEIRAKLVAGDKDTTESMEDDCCNLLDSRVQWAGLIQATARGENAFAKVLDKAIADAAEVMAIKDAEEAEKDYKNERAEYQYDMARLFGALAPI